MNHPNITNCYLIDFPKVHDARGDLTFIEENRHVPFSIKRIYYLYNVPQNAIRAKHAHKTLQQILIPIAGNFHVTVDDGRQKQVYYLTSARQGLFVPPYIWREISNFSPGAVCLVLASEPYDENDYFRDYQDFLDFIRGQVK